MPVLKDGEKNLNEPVQKHKCPRCGNIVKVRSKDDIKLMCLRCLNTVMERMNTLTQKIVGEK